MLNGGAILWAARKVRIIPDSTAKAETASASRVAKDMVAIRMVLGDMRIIVEGATPMLGDCKATRDIITKSAVHIGRSILREQHCWSSISS